MHIALNKILIKALLNTLSTHENIELFFCLTLSYDKQQIIIFLNLKKHHLHHKVHQI